MNLCLKKPELEKRQQYEEDIKTQERIQNREAGKESGIDATEATSN